MAANVGVTFGLIVMFNVVGPAQLPVAGVKVYAVVPRVAVLIAAGFHVPLIPSSDVAGSAGATAFWQNAFGIAANVGVTFVEIVMFIDTGVAQLPAVGVNVYAVVPSVVVFIVAGFHVPVTPWSDVAGNAGAAAF